MVGPGEQIGGGPQRKRAKVDTDLESRLRKHSLLSDFSHVLAHLLTCT